MLPLSPSSSLQLKFSRMICQLLILVRLEIALPTSRLTSSTAGEGEKYNPMMSVSQVHIATWCVDFYISTGLGFTKIAGPLSIPAFGA